MTSMLSKLKNLTEHDFSKALSGKAPKLDDLARYGIEGNITAMTFDPVQSLLAVATDVGVVTVMGQKNVSVSLSTTVPEAIKFVRFVKSVYLVAIDTRGKVTVFDTETLEVVYEYRASGIITAVESDPSLDWLFLGLDNGQIVIYDVDRGVQAPFRVGNIQKSLAPKERMSPVLSLALHPRDIASLLVTYRSCTVIFSLARNEITLSFKYELAAYAMGGDLDPMTYNRPRSPHFISAVWHPNGHHVLTTHEDGSLVFWDAVEGTLLQARTVFDTDVNIPRRGVNASFGTTPERRFPIYKVSWACSQRAEDTSVLISGGGVVNGPIQGLTMLDYGNTPEVSITSYQSMGQHYAMPKRNKVFPLPENIQVVDFIFLTRDPVPYYAGNFNPCFVLNLLSSGELLLLKYPEGEIVTDPSILPAGLSWVNPYVTALSCGLVPRTQWIGAITSASKNKDTIFCGGAPAKRHLRTYDVREAFCTGHSDGTVKVWDASHGEIEDAATLEVNMAEALARHYDLAVSKISFAGNVMEISVAVSNGDVALFTFGLNKNSNNIPRNDNPTQTIQDIRGRTNPYVKMGFLPRTMVKSNTAGAVTALKNSDIGFVAIGYESGQLMVIDRRGPASIFCGEISDLLGGSKSSSRTFKRNSRPVNNGLGHEHVTTAEFSIIGLGDEQYSSIVLTAGTSFGNVLTFKIVPDERGRYVVQFVGSCNVGEGPVISLSPINLERGESAVATGQVMSQLAQGIYIPGALVAVTPTEARVIRQPDHKISHRTFNFECLAAGTAKFKDGDSLALVCLAIDCSAKILSVPGLRELTKTKLPYDLAPAYAKDSIITGIGDIIVRTSKTSGALVKIWGRGFKFGDISPDALYDPRKVIPTRPTISTLQWVKGRQYISTQDLDALLGGPRRPRARKFIEQQEKDYSSINAPSSSSSSRPTRTNTPNSYSSSANKSRATFQSKLDDLGNATNEYMNGLSEMFDDATKNAKKASLSASLKGYFS